MSKTINSADQYGLFGDEPQPAPKPEPPPAEPPRLELIQREENGIVIDQRPTDGYFNATAMCRAYGKRFNDFAVTNECKEFLSALSSITGILVIELVQSRRGQYGGTWVHPDFAVRLAMWISPKFAVKVCHWFLEWACGQRTIIAGEDFDIQRIVQTLANLEQDVMEVRQAVGYIAQTVTENGVNILQVAHPGSAVAVNALLERERRRHPGTASGLPQLVQPRSRKPE